MSSEDAKGIAEQEPETEQQPPASQRPAKKDALPPSQPVDDQELEAERGPNAQFWLVVVGVVIAGMLWGYRGSHSKVAPAVMQTGSVVDAPITLVTADRHELACAMQGDIAGCKCAWSEPSTKNSVDPVHTLAPYMTTAGQLFLVAGLFEQPQVSLRYDRERPDGRKREELRRFTATCKLKLMGEAPEVRLQFSQGSPWGESVRAWVGVPSECTTVNF